MGSFKFNEKLLALPNRLFHGEDAVLHVSGCMDFINVRKWIHVFYCETYG